MSGFTDRGEPASYRVRELVRRVAVDEFDATTVEEPIEGFDRLTRTRLVEPLAGVRAAQLVAEVAAGLLREWALEARGAGQGWGDLADALALGEDGEGRSAAEVAWEWLVEHRPPHPVERYRFEPVTAVWTCRTCAARVRDTGPFESHPDDREQGHAPGCTRHTAALARWRQDHDWDDDEAGDETDDEAGHDAGDEREEGNR